MKVKCQECGKRFTVSPKNTDPECPKCHGVDIDIDYTVSRNYSVGPFDFMPEVA